MAMGSPLGPAFANIFMNTLETKYLEECNNSFKPLFYKRYIDDTSALEVYVSKRQKQKAEKIAAKVFQYSKCYTLKCF